MRGDIYRFFVLHDMLIRAQNELARNVTRDRI